MLILSDMLIFEQIDVIWPKIALSKHWVSNVSDLPCGSYCGAFFWLVSVKTSVMRCVCAWCGWFTLIQRWQRVRLPKMLAFQTALPFMYSKRLSKRAIWSSIILRIVTVRGATLTFWHQKGCERSLYWPADLLSASERSIKIFLTKLTL